MSGVDIDTDKEKSVFSQDFSACLCGLQVDWTVVRKSGNRVIYEKAGFRHLVPDHGAKEMTKVNIIFARAKDGNYSAYCEEHPALFGMGDSAEDALKDLEETLRLTKDEIGRENAAVYPGWLDGEYEFVFK